MVLLSAVPAPMDTLEMCVKRTLMIAPPRLATLVVLMRASIWELTHLIVSVWMDGPVSGVKLTKTHAMQNHVCMVHVLQLEMDLLVPAMQVGQALYVISQRS
jgi:hypothetical protein